MSHLIYLTLVYQECWIICLSFCCESPSLCFVHSTLTHPALGTYYEEYMVHGNAPCACFKHMHYSLRCTSQPNLLNSHMKERVKFFSVQCTISCVSHYFVLAAPTPPPPPPHTHTHSHTRTTSSKQRNSSMPTQPSHLLNTHTHT